MAIVASIAIFFAALAPLVEAAQFLQVGIIDALSLIAGIAGIVGSVALAIVATSLLNTKIMKETFFFVLFVATFSALSYSILHLFLRIAFPLEWIVVLSVIVGTPVSCRCAGYSARTFWAKMENLGWNQGITLFTLLVLASLPVISLYSSRWIIGVTGVVGLEGPFQKGSDSEMVNGQIANSTFTAEIPMPADTMFSAEDILNVTNRSNALFPLKISIQELDGNLSTLGQLDIFLTQRNDSRVYLLTIKEGNLAYSEIHLTMNAQSSMTVGVVCLQNQTSIPMVMFFSMRCAENTITTRISIE